MNNRIDEFWLCVNKDGTGHIGIYRVNSVGETTYSSVRKLSVAKCAYFQITFNRMLREQTIRVHDIQIDDGWTIIRYFPVDTSDYNWMTP